MDIALYHCTDNARCRSKTIGKVQAEYDVKLKDNSSIYRPTFILKYSSSFNFDKMKEFINYLCCNIGHKRYYFINDIVLQPNGTIEIICEEDLLYTYSSEIAELPLSINRIGNSNNIAPNTYIQDNKCVVETRATPTIKPFTGGTGFSNELSYVLQCAGVL